MYIREKSIVTVILWFLVCASVVALTVSGGLFTNPIPIVLFLTVAAAVATRFIWNSTAGVEALMREQVQMQQ